MRILAINWRCIRNPLAGGAEVYFQEIFRRLAARGHEVTLLCERYPGSLPEEVIDGIKVIRKGGKWTFNFTAGVQVGRLAEQGGVDVVIDDLNKIPFFSPWHTKRPVLALLMHLFRASIFRETLPPLAAYVWLAESMIPWAYKRSHFAVLSDSSKADVVRLGIPDRQIAVIPPGTDFDRFHPAQSAVSNLRSEVPVVLHVGRLKKYKSTDHLLKATNLLKGKGRRFKVVIVGDGDDLPRLKELSAKLGIAEMVEFTGFIPEDEKLAWYHQAAMLTENSVKEGWGLIVMEANACGTPVVVARSPGLVDSSKNGVNGLFYEYGNIPELAEKIDLLLAEPETREQLGRKAIAWARQWTWEGAAAAMEKTIEQTISRAG